MVNFDFYLSNEKCIETIFTRTVSKRVSIDKKYNISCLNSENYQI